jgi:hypothetical protein
MASGRSDGGGTTAARAAGGTVRREAGTKAGPGATGGPQQNKQGQGGRVWRVLWSIQ